MMSHCLPDCILKEGLYGYLLGIRDCQKISTWEHKQNLSHQHLFWTFLLCCFPLRNNFAMEWFSAAPDFLLVASLCLEMLGQSYQEHGFVYLSWGMLMIWCYTSTHGVPKDQLIWMSICRSILFTSQHSLKVFHVFFYWFHSRLHAWLLRTLFFFLASPVQNRYSPLLF